MVIFIDFTPIKETVMLRSRSFCARVFASALAASAACWQRLRPTSSSGDCGAAMPAILRNYQPVTAERLMNPEANSWLVIRRTYDGWGYSPLANNVA